MKRRDITITIDGKECKGKFGQTILEIARELWYLYPNHVLSYKDSTYCLLSECVLYDVKGR